jgi:hypothetical protein
MPSFKVLRWRLFEVERVVTEVDLGVKGTKLISDPLLDLLATTAPNPSGTHGRVATPAAQLSDLTELRRHATTMLRGESEPADRDATHLR